MTKPGHVTPAMQRKLLRAQKAAKDADAAYRALIREALDQGASTRVVGEALSISHSKVQRLTKPPTD
ncbi:hypothetical protein [Microbacterium sp. 2FI]|uniref:hypothetical protein n=1 Tax=Microbacterium sp. 2FI TaxID=2502193 RepID=UPI0010F9263C|nr:hypothetical protein [Microbacterium sp. 2FI]